MAEAQPSVEVAIAQPSDDTADTVKAEPAPVTKAEAPAPAVAETKAAAAKPAGGRYAQMVVATMTKPETAATTVEETPAPAAMPAAERPTVASSQRPAGSAFARQAVSAPMTKPKAAE